MNTQWTQRVRLCALAAVGLALAGLGSVKSPFGILEAGMPQSAGSDDALFFHTSTGQPALEAPAQPLGPGPWSPKSQSWSLYQGTQF